MEATHTPELARLGLLTRLDRAALSSYCSAWSRYVEDEAALVQSGAVVPGRDGVQVTNPWARISRQSAETMLRIASEFGMTPAARTRINVMPPPTGGGGGFEF